MSKIKLSDYIAKRLKEHGVKHFFMVSGGGAMHLNDSLGRAIPYTANHHEQACAIAAEGYARLNQDLAVVNITTGPGGLNCLNGVFGQWTDSVPVLYISGQVKYTTTMASCPDIPLRQLGDQEVDIISVVKPLTKYAKMVTEPNEIKYHIDKAINAAVSGRPGPVWLDIPMNVQAAMIEEDELKEFVPAVEKESRFDTKEIIEKLKSAKRPLIIAGHGIRLAGQIENFKKLTESIKIPVVTTLNGVDILEDDNPYYIGRIGTIGQRAGNFALQNADVVLCLGTRNNIRQASYNWENFAKNAFKIVVDIDKAELEKPTVKPDLAVAEDLRELIPNMLEELNTPHPNSQGASEVPTLTAGEGIQSVHSTSHPDLQRENDFSEWLGFCNKLKTRFSEIEQEQKTDVIEPYHFTHCLTKCMAENDVLVMANGSACVCTFQNAIVKKGQRFILNSGNASMGYGLPAAIGAGIGVNTNYNTPSPLAGEGARRVDEGGSNTNYAISSPLAGEDARRAGEGYYNTTSHRIYADYIKEFARELRKNQTEQEQKLWAILRNFQTGYKFRRQHQINNKYIADFVCLEKRLIIELDGGQHCNSNSDKQRTFYLESENFRILRFWNNEIDENIDGCYQVIIEELNTPHPNPLPQGARGQAHTTDYIPQEAKEQANNQGRIVCLEGDGSIMMNLQELQTIVYNQLPIKLFVINNSGYSSIRQTQRNFFQGHMTGSGEDSGVSVPDFVEIGKAFGLKTKRIENPETMEQEINEVLNTDGAILCEVMVEKEYGFAPKLSARKLDDGTMVSPSLEDMFPFLDRNTFEECIIE